MAPFEAVTPELLNKLAHDYGLDLREMQGTGPGGAITKGDLEAHFAKLSQYVGLTPAVVRDPVPPPEPEERTLYPDGRSTYFTLLPCDGIYEITVGGVVKSKVTEEHWFSADHYVVESDALVSTFTRQVLVGNRDSVGFYESESKSWRETHYWLRINGDSLETLVNQQKAEIVEADYDRHRFRFRVAEPRQQLKLLFEMHGTGRRYSDPDGALRVTVRGLPGVRLTLNQRFGAERAKRLAKQLETQRALQEALGVAPHPAVPSATLPEKHIETKDAYRDRWCRNIDRSSEDLRAVLAKIAEGRQKLMDDLNAMKLDTECDVYRQYASEIENWTAGQLMLFTERKGGDNGPATVIG